MGESKYSPEEQAEIQKEGAKHKEGGRLEATGEQMDDIKKEIDSDLKSESLEVKSLEELKQKAIEAGASPEEIEVLDAELEIARMGADEYLAQLEDEYNKAVQQRQNLESRKTREAQHDEDEKRLRRDLSISGALAMGSPSVIGAGYFLRGFLGGDFYGIAAAAGMLGGSVAMLGSPIARIQNWFARRKRGKELTEARKKQGRTHEAYWNAKLTGVQKNQ